MLDEPMLGGIGALVTELRADGDLAALVGVDLANRVRVRGGDPVGQLRQSGGDYAGDVREASDYQTFVVLVTLDEPPHPSVPIFRGVYGANCYGRTRENARAVWGAVVKAIHRVGPRLKANGLGIYISVVEGGGEQDTDPDNDQPVVRGTIRITATAQAIA